MKNNKGHMAPLFSREQKAADAAYERELANSFQVERVSAKNRKEMATGLSLRWDRRPATGAYR